MNDLAVIGKEIKIELARQTVATPKNYSLENALVAAGLILSEAVDRNKRPVLEVCSPESIKKALLTMAVQGLNPAKNQCYFVAYGQQLQCIRSYMGSQMTAKLVNPAVKEINAEVVYSGDEFKFAVKNGKKVIGEHTQTLESLDKADIVAAYAVALDKDGNQLFSDLMTMNEIKQAWKQSKVSPVTESGNINAGSTHGKFTEEMARRTVINRLCKKIINTSDDEMILAAADETITIREEIGQNANRIPLDFPAPQPQLPPAASQEDPNACTADQRRRIVELSKLQNRDKEKSLEHIGGFVGRKIERTKELTRQEAAGYIAVIEAEMQEQPAEDEKPPWG
jgi:recombination protein RecT